MSSRWPDLYLIFEILVDIYINVFLQAFFFLYRFSSALEQLFSSSAFCLQSSSSMSTSWADLPIDILYLIFEKLVDNNMKDVSNCAGVCCSWRFVSDQLIKRLSPVILLTNQGSKRDLHGGLVSTSPNQGKYCLFNTRTRLTQETMLPELCGRWFRSAWPGWLFTANCNYPHEIRLLNPLSRAQITLPRTRYEGLCAEIFKLVPSSSPLDSNCIILKIRGDAFPGVIGFCRPGDETWSSTTTIDYLGEKVSILDAIYHKGAFYIVVSTYYSGGDYMYRIHIDETTMALTVKSILPFPKLDRGFGKACYLVELMGELLVIETRYMQNPRKEWQKGATDADITVEAHQLQVLDADNVRWESVESLGGKHAIYAGRFHSLSIYVGDGNVHEECRRPNCVYFVDEFRLWKDRNGVYDFETRRFEELAFPRTLPLNWFGFQ